MRILEPGRNCCGIFDQDEAGLIIDGENFFRAFARAAERAESYLLLAGWQFDSDVRLVRDPGPHDEAGYEEEGLARFLTRLTERKPGLRVYILAWDFSVLFALDREWFQKLLFEWASGGRIHFRFDDRHAVGASHHQKLVVVDGELAFVGGLDISSTRWDRRAHRIDDPLRVDSRGKPYGPYHDIQSLVTGPAARELAGLFRQRWEDSGGDPLDLPEAVSSTAGRRVGAWAGPVVPVDSPAVAISRTRAKTLVPLKGSVTEIRDLYADAIRAAETHIYIENQFFSSAAVYHALLDRMKDTGMGPLEVVIVLPERPHTVVEEISPGIAQVKMLKALKGSVKGTEHRVGVYYTTSTDAGEGGGGGNDGKVHIHSKLLIVDDRFITVGSANASNRSMGLDTELNLAWEADGEGTPLERSIRRIRASLLMEHSGLLDSEARRTFAPGRGIVELLDRMESRKGCRLHAHKVDTVLAGGRWIEPEKLDVELDFGEPIVEENVFELIGDGGSGLFRKGIVLLNETLGHRPEAALAGGSVRPVTGRRRRRLLAAAAIIITGIAALTALVIIR